MPHATHSVCSVCTSQSGTQQLAAGLTVGDGCSKGHASSRPHTCAGAPSLSGCTSSGAFLGSVSSVSSCTALCVLDLCAHSNSSGRAFVGCCCLCCCKVAVAWTQVWSLDAQSARGQLCVEKRKDSQAGLARTVHTHHEAAAGMAVCVDCAASCAKRCSNGAYCECRDIAAVGVPHLACQTCCAAFIGTQPSWAASASSQLMTAARYGWWVFTLPLRTKPLRYSPQTVPSAPSCWPVHGQTFSKCASARSAAVPHHQLLYCSHQADTYPKRSDSLSWGFRQRVGSCTDITGCGSQLCAQRAKVRYRQSQALFPPSTNYLGRHTPSPPPLSLPS